MPAAMAGATGFIYPSYYEGFGFPVVQAMAVGTPVNYVHGFVFTGDRGGCCAVRESP
jgi:glycosyltransferase involved in cell wall biosynthesis